MFAHWVSDTVLRTHLLDFAPTLRYHFKTRVYEGVFRGVQIKQSTDDEELPCTGTGDGSRVQGLVSPDFQGKDVFTLAMSSNNRPWVQV